jgi:hypothetical protein
MFSDPCVSSMLGSMRKNKPSKDGEADDQDAATRDQTFSVDEALERVQLGRGQIFGISVNLMLAICDGMQLTAMFYLPKALRHDWGTAPDAVAWLDGALLLGSAVGIIIGQYQKSTHHKCR